MEFEAYGLNPRLQRQLRKVGVDKFFPVQAQCFEKVRVRFENVGACFEEVGVKMNA